MKPNRMLIALLVVAAAGGGWFWWSGGAATATGIDIADREFVERGRVLYAQQCAACHGKNLQGQTPAWRSPLPDGSFPAPPHDETGHTWHHPDEMLFAVTKLGREAASGGRMRSNMPGFGDTMSDADIWAVLSYIKSRWPENVRRRHDRINQRAEGR